MGLRKDLDEVVPKPPLFVVRVSLVLWQTPLRKSSPPGGGRAYSFVACLSRLTIDHASFSRRSTVPTSNRDTSNIWALITFFPYYYIFFVVACFIPSLFRRLWPPSISQESDRFLATIYNSVPNFSISQSPIFYYCSRSGCAIYYFEVHYYIIIMFEWQVR